MYVPHRESRRTQQVPASCRTPLKRQSSAHKLKGDTVISHFYCPHYSNFDPKRGSRVTRKPKSRFVRRGPVEIQ